MNVKKMIAASASALVLSASAIAGADEIDILKAELELLNQRVKSLESGSGSESGYTKKGNNKLWLKLSGHVNRGVLWGDNGHNEQVFHVDSDNSSSRFRLEAGGRYNQDITIGTNVELQVESNSTQAVRFEQNEQGGGTDVLSDRKIEIFVKHARYGTLWFGQGNMASFYAGSVDLSGSDLAVYSGVADMAGGLQFFAKAGAAAGFASGLGPRVNQVFDSFDGLGRRDRIRYDSPVWNGWMVSTSFADDRHHDIALRYSELWNDIKIAAAIAYAESNRGGTGPNQEGFDIINGSISVLFPSGWSVTFMASQRDDEGSPAGNNTNDDKANAYYIKLGYLFNYFAFGQTAVGLDYFRIDDFGVNTPDLPAADPDFANQQLIYNAVFANNEEGVFADSWGFGVVQNVDPIATQIYLAIRNYDIDISEDNVELDSIWAVLFGGRVKY